ncbi:MAG TPA: filamentous hemagglutinin N-terminal domain-containing protein [Caulobacteraceae bacterium]
MIRGARPWRQMFLGAGLSVAALVAPLAGVAAPALPQGPTIAGSTGAPGATFDTSVANTLNVNQSTSRVVIDWRSFDIGAGDTVNFHQAAQSWVAFNRVTADPTTGLSPLSTIAGTVNAQGGVWLFSTGGILFGPTAVVNVGSFVGITGPLGNNNDVSQLLNPDTNGVTTVAIEPAVAAGIENITVQSGAQINAASGFVALQAETLVQDGAVTAFDGVEYLVSQAGQLQFTTDVAGQQLLPASVTPVVGVDRPSFTQAGSSSGAWVGIDAPGGALQAGYHTLINVGGEIQASGIKPGTTDEGIVFLVGGAQGPATPGATDSSIGVDASSATLTATNGLLILTDSARLGSTILGGPLDVETYGDIAIVAPVTVGAGAQLNSARGAVAIDANLTANQDIGAAGQTISVGPNVTVRSDSLGAGNGGIVLGAVGDVVADPTSLLIAGILAASPTDNVTVNAGLGPQGGNLSVGSVSGVNLFIHAQSRAVPGEGALTLAGTIVGTASILAYVDDVTDANNPTGPLQILGAVSSSGFIDIENLGTGAMVVGPGASVQSSGDQVFLTDGGDTTFESGARLTGVSFFDHTAGALTIAAGASVTTTGTSRAPSAPLIPFGGEFQRSSGLNLAAGTLNIAGSVTAGTPAAPDDIYIEVLGAGPATIGGSGGGAGFDLTNASFSHLSARDVIVMGGPGEAEGPGADLTVDDLSLDSGKISALWLGTASANSITVSGAVTQTGSGPVDVQIGFARQGAGAAGGLDGFIPGQIDITGALGSSSAPLGGVDLIARGDILVGVPTFVAAAQADANFDAVKQSSAFAASQGQVFLAAGALQLSAQGRIIQQNTAPSLLSFAGLDIGAPTSGRPLIAVPAALEGQLIGGVWTADFSAGPSRIDLFGALTTAGGRIVDDLSAAQLPDLLAPPIATQVAYRINTCEFGQVCSPPTTAIQFEPPPDSEAAAQAAAQSGFIFGGVRPTNVFSALTQASTQQDDDRLGDANPLTEAGNGDLAAGGSAGCTPRIDPDRKCQ